MRLLAAALAAALTGPAWAQSPPPPPLDQGIQSQPLAPPAPNQGIQSQPLAPPGQSPGTQPPPSLTPAPGPAQPPPPPQWLPRATAELEVLDKLEATSRNLAVPVGQSAQVGSLTIAVKECVVRPPDQAPDAAAYLVITDSDQGEAGFQGWMLADEPWVAMLQSPLYDVRVLGCR